MEGPPRGFQPILGVSPSPQYSAARLVFSSLETCRCHLEVNRSNGQGRLAKLGGRRRVATVQTKNTREKAQHATTTKSVSAGTFLICANFFFGH